MTLVSPTVPRRAALLTAVLTARPAMPQPAASLMSPEASMAEPHGLEAPPAQPGAMPQGEQHPVTVWTRLGLALTAGIIAQRALPTLHLAMHDALNAAEPRFTRHRPPEPVEPTPGRASAAPRLAMAAAAAEVLAGLHPQGAAGAAPFLAAARSGVAAHAAAAAQALGQAIGRAALRRMEGRVFGIIHMEGGNRAWQWRPTPPVFAPTQLMVFAPFITPITPALFGPGPNPPGSPRYRQDLAEVREIGGINSRSRSAEEGDLASYWVGRDLDRSTLLMAATMMEAAPGALHDEARAMAQIAVAMADTYVAWAAAKQHANFWRPVTAIRDGALPFTAAHGWLPWLPTPAHPEFPSGHAADCTAMAVMLSAHFAAANRPVLFQGEGAGGRQDRRFDSMLEAAEICRLSRLWAGAHFRAANDDGQRLGEAVARNSLAALAPLGQ